MPIKTWENGAILIYKKARYIVPIVIAAAGAVAGYLLGKWHKRSKGGKGERAQTAPLPEGKST